MHARIPAPVLEAWRTFADTAGADREFIEQCLAGVLA